jgi:hypothetical protein
VGGEVSGDLSQKLVWAFNLPALPPARKGFFLQNAAKFFE